MKAVSRPLALAAALLLAALWFSGLDHRSLVRPDEGRYGEIAREMATSGDWVTPRLNAYRYFEKPPLQYWATATAYRLFGVDEWTTRLWTALTGFAGIALVFLFANRILGPPAGFVAAAVLAGSGLYAFMGQLATLDMAFACFATLAVFGFALGQMDDAPPAARRRWMWAGWLGMALATLSKGLAGVVLPVAAVGVYILLRRDFRRLRELRLLTGGLLFLAVTAPWFVLVADRNPEFLRFFFIQEHFQRYTSTLHGRYEPFWYFVPVLAIGILPWLPAALAALWFAPRERSGARFEPVPFLVAWCATVFLFFSASDSKLPSYVLPIFPALAVLIAWQLARADRRFLAFQAGFGALAGLGLALFGLFIDRFAGSDTPHAVTADYRPWLVGAGALLLLASAGSLALAAQGRRVASMILLGIGALAATKAVTLGHESHVEQRSAGPLIARAQPAFAAAAQKAPLATTPFFMVELFDHTIPWYLGRTVTLVADKDELSQAIAWEPRDFVPDTNAFLARWAELPQAYAILRPHVYEAMRRERGFAAEIISSSRRLVIVRKP